MSEEEKNTIPGWKDIPIGGKINEAGSADKYETGDWRTYKPMVNQDKCINCYQCWVYCPDSAINVKDGEMVGFNYSHCKGCGICASICPVDAIEMKKEGEEDEDKVEKSKEGKE